MARQKVRGRRDVRPAQKVRPKPPTPKRKSWHDIVDAMVPLARHLGIGEAQFRRAMEAGRKAETKRLVAILEGRAR